MTDTPTTTPATWTIREATADEWQAAGEVVARAYESLGVPTSDGYLDHIRDVADRAATCRIFVAVDVDGSVLGCVTYVPHKDSPYAESERDGDAGVRMLGVAPAARGQGIGRALIAACVAQARIDRRERLVLVTTGAFKDAARMYLRMGFRRARDRDFVVEPGIHLRGYELDLRDPS